MSRKSAGSSPCMTSLSVAHKSAKGKMKANTPNDGVAYIFFCGGIDENSVHEMVETITAKIPHDVRTLYILMSTNGGSVGLGFVLYNFLRALPYKIVMHNIGSIESIGVVIFLAGEERYTNANGTFLIHRVSGMLSTEIVGHISLREKLGGIDLEENRIKTVLLENSTMPPEEIGALFIEGQLKDANYAWEKGIIHEIRDIILPSAAKIWVIKTPSLSPK